MGMIRPRPESKVRDALRRIQDIVADSSGAALSKEAEKRVENVLSGMVDGKAHGSPLENFSQRDVTIVLADLRGFTSLAAAHPAGVVLEMLNGCFSKMSESIVRHHGTIDHFAGDSIMAIFFGEAGARSESVCRAVACAVEMQVAMVALNRQHKDLKLPPLYIGIGVNTGRVMVGLVGSELYSAYTVIGEEVNLTSRIEAFSLRGQVLISQSTYDACANFVQTGEPMEVYVKGKAERVRLREVVAIPSLGAVVPRQEIRRSPRVTVKLPLVFQLLENKIVVPERLKGTILDIGYHGVLVEVEGDYAPLAEVKLDLELPLVIYRASDIYARVVKVAPKGGRSLLGLEFTSLGAETNSKLQLFVQMLLQGHES